MPSGLRNAMMRMNKLSKLPAGLSVLALAAVTGCTNDTPGTGLALRSGGGGFLSGLTARTPGPIQLHTVARLAGGEVVIPAPAGWCVEPASLKAKGQSGFALFAGCAAMTEDQAGPWVPAGVLTATVSRRRAPGDVIAPDALRRVVSEAQVQEQQLRDGVALVHLMPAKAASEDGLGDPHWRAVFVSGGRAISLAAYGPAQGEISGQSGGELLLYLARGIRSNAGAAGG